MKRLFVLFAILALAIVAMPAFATEALGPPGITAVPADFDAVLSPVAVQVPKEFNVVGLDSVLASTYAVPDVVPVYLRPVPGLAADPVMCTSAKPMLAGLMYGALLPSMTDTAAEAYVMLMASGNPDLPPST